MDRRHLFFEEHFRFQPVKASFFHRLQRLDKIKVIKVHTLLFPDAQQFDALESLNRCLTHWSPIWCIANVDDVDDDPHGEVVV